MLRTIKWENTEKLLFRKRKALIIMLLFELSVRTYLSVLISNVSSVMSFSCNDFAARYFSNFERNFFQGNREDYFMDKEKYSYFIRKYT